MAAHLTEEELLQAAIAASLEEYKNLVLRFATQIR
jgi:hypothetical protein